MDQQQWQIANEIAQSLQQHGTDVNELKKLVSYLRWWQHRQPTDSHTQLETHLIDYLHNLVNYGETRSQQTSGYYQTLEKICDENLELFTTDIEISLQILGWAARLALYYKHDPQPNEPIVQDKKPANKGSKTSMAAAFERAKRPQ